MNELDSLRHENAELRERLERAETDRQRLETLVRSSPVGMLVIDAETRAVVLVNDEVERIIGMPNTLGSSLDLYHEITLYRRMDGRQYAAEERPLARILNGGEPARAEEILFVRPDGQTVVVLINTTPIYSEDGQVKSAVAVIQDLTPIEELEKARNEFLGIVSHELRNPLTTIKGAATSALDSSVPFDAAESRQFFRMIERDADRMRNLISGLLDMTRIEAGAFSVAPEPLDLICPLDDARSAFLRGDARNPIEMELAPDMPSVSADRQRVAQTLNNLLSNASRHSDDSSPIRISVEPSEDRLFAAISVADAGMGIAADRLPHVFRKFSGVEGGGERDDTGLGLAICKGIVKAHGGRIWAESEGLGHGARFTFTLPLSAEAEPGAADSRLAHPIAKPGELARILAVDDDPNMLRYVRGILSDARYSVRVTGNPDRIFELLGTEPPQLILLDLVLDGVSGFDLMERIREESEVPVIFVSGREEEYNVVRALSLCADDYIVKPFSPPQLLARIDASLRKRARLGQNGPREPYRLGDLEIDYARREVTLSGSPVQLTATEYRLLSELSANAGRVLTHGQLLERVWGYDHSGETNTARNLVKNLRRKLGDYAASPKYIFTETGIGYRMGGA